MDCRSDVQLKMFHEPVHRDARFEATLIRTETGCLVWARSRSGGYGLVRRRKLHHRYIYAHRYAWYLHYGEWVPQVNHRCDNPPCCEITHLYAGTQQENIRDMVTRRRCVYKLTSRQEDEILHSTEPTQRLADRYHVSFHTIWRIRKSVWQTNRTGLAAQLRRFDVGDVIVLAPKRPASLHVQADLIGIKIRAKRIDDMLWEITRYA